MFTKLSILVLLVVVALVPLLGISSKPDKVEAKEDANLHFNK